MAVQRDSDRRRSIRLREYDYASPGAYFVTLCTHGGEALFGQVVDGEMVLNECGRVIEEEWHSTARLRPYVRLDAYVIMPNHFHGILWIDHTGRGMARHAPTREFGKPVAASLPTLVGAFKSAVTRRINQVRGTPGVQVWQRNYWEHVIRTDRALNAIRRYIADNPARWTLDRYNLAATGSDPRVADLWRMLRDDAATVGARRAMPLRRRREER